MMPASQRSFKRIGAGLGVLLLGSSTLLYGQTKNRVQNDRADSTSERGTELSELAKDNLNRVAASAVDIRDVLVKNPGLLVELKRWVAKEAADNGQVVEDASLSDQAIFDRVDSDVLFRSVATRLLQRYGYLLPTTNPDSNLGKQEEFVLKERARRLVQIEAQEDSQSLKPENPEENPRVTRETNCNPDASDCEAARPKRRPSQQMREQEEQAPEPGPRLSPDAPRTLQADVPNDLQMSREGSLIPQVEFAADSATPIDGVPLLSQTTISSPAQDQFREKKQLRPAPSQAPEYVANGDTLGQSTQFSRRRLEQTRPREDSSPVRMVHSANPYADVPSLYDMYVQAAAVQRPAERFGLDVFRNTTNQPDVIPMDLPVGPDYVVGTG